MSGANKPFRLWHLMIVGCALAAKAALAQGCSMPPESDFTVVEVFKGMDHADAMAVGPNGEVFAIEQWTGNVWHYIPGKAAAKIGTVPTNPGLKVEDGMLGVVFDLNYTRTHWLYIYHTPAVLGSTQISRFTITNEQLTNQKVILTIPRTRVGSGHDERHAGGGMAWNARTGDLYLSVGDDTYPFGDRSIYGPRDPDNAYSNALRTAGNTNDLRGKCLRIRPIPFPDSQSPTPGAGATYAIPAGNLFPPGTDKTRPEIYTMGTRNAYRVKTDTLTGWAFIGEVGADAQVYDSAKGPPGYDHVYLIKGASNFGWPFGNGNMEPYKVRDYEQAYLAAGMKVGQNFDLAHLKNLSTVNTGLIDLPPVTPPLIWYCNNNYQQGIPSKLGGGAETAMMGPTYDYNPAINSAVKLPPYFHRKVIFGDYSRHYIWLATLSANGTLQNLERIKAGYSMTDMNMGPDGTLYFLDYNGGTLNSLQYTGSQKDYHACSFIKEGCTDPQFSEYDQTANLQTPGACKTAVAIHEIRAPGAIGPDRILANLAASMRVSLPPGVRSVQAYSLSGTKVFAAIAESGANGGYVQLPESLAGHGVLFLKFLRN